MGESRVSQRVRIVSDGTPNGTRVTDEVSGREFAKVTSVQWGIDVEDVGRATVNVIFPTVDVSTVLAEVVGRCALCGHEESLDVPPLESDANG